MRRTAGLITVTTLAVAFAAPSAGAAPPVAEQFTCNGRSTTLVHPPGKTATIDGQRYVVASFSFAPTGGDPETETFGQKAGLSDPLTCTQAVPGEGTFTAVLLPVPPGT
jgi:hypothetical protein